MDRKTAAASVDDMHKEYDEERDLNFRVERMSSHDSHILHLKEEPGEFHLAMGLNDDHVTNHMGSTLHGAFGCTRSHNLNAETPFVSGRDNHDDIFDDNVSSTFGHGELIDKFRSSTEKSSDSSIEEINSFSRQCSATSGDSDAPDTILSASQNGFVCFICDQVFKKKNHLKQHMVVHRRRTQRGNTDEEQRLTSLTNHEQQVVSDVTKASYVCSVCDKRFRRSDCLAGHMRTHTGERPYACTECTKRFARRSNLTLHILTHTGEKPHKCLECGKGFSSSSDLRKHTMIHTGEKNHLCPKCKRTFRISSHLKQHMLTHNKDNLHACPQCNKTFSRPCSLQQHILIHADDEAETGALHRRMAHSCPQCFKRFIHLSVLQRHVLTHGEKRYTCCECDKKFARPTDIKRHMTTHTGEKPHVCIECDKRFSQTSDLKRHMLIHTGVKPHGCPECQKRFTQSNDLKQHMLIHTGEKPHICLECNKRFTLTSNLRKHVRTHRRKDNINTCRIQACN